MKTFIQKTNDSELFKFTKENFSLIIFIPSLLGGIRQFILLFYYSPTLIQYFSFSQIIIDGIDILIQLLYVLVINVIAYKIIIKKENYIYYLQSFLAFVVIIFAGIYFFYFYDDINIKQYNIVNHNEYLFKQLLLTVIALSLASNIISLSSFKIVKSKILNTAFYIISTFSILYMFLVALFFKPFQYNVENISKITNEVRLKKSKSTELIYYNDSYLIFLLNPQDGYRSRKFYIKKFESLFNEE